MCKNDKNTLCAKYVLEIAVTLHRRKFNDWSMAFDRDSSTEIVQGFNTMLEDEKASYNNLGFADLSVAVLINTFKEVVG